MGRISPMGRPMGPIDSCYPFITPIGRMRATFFARARLVDDVDDEIDILVRVRLLFRESLPALSAGDDAAARKFLVDAPALRLRSRPRCGSSPARRRGRSCQRSVPCCPRCPDQHPARPAHVARDEHRLTDAAIHGLGFRDDPAERRASRPCDAPRPSAACRRCECSSNLAMLWQTS